LTCDIIDRVETEGRVLVGSGHWVAPESEVGVRPERTTSAAAWRASSRTSARSAPDALGSGATWLATGAATAAMLPEWGMAGWSVAAAQGALMRPEGRHDLAGAKVFLLRPSKGAGEESGAGPARTTTDSGATALIVFKNSATPDRRPGGIVGEANRTSSSVVNAPHRVEAQAQMVRIVSPGPRNLCLRSGDRDARA
jgi:hypothetical protein